MNYLLIVCLCTIIVSVFRTIRRGTPGIIYGVITWVIAVFIVSQGVGPVSNYLTKNPKTHDFVEEKVSPFIGIIGQIDSIAGNITVDGEDGTSLEDIPSAEELARQYFQGFAGTEEQLDAYENYVMYGIPMDNTGFGGIDTGNENINSMDLGNFAGALSSGTDQYAELKEYVFRFVFELLAMAICYLMAKVFFLIVNLVIKGFTKDSLSKPVIPSVLWGICEGILYMDVYLMLISRLQFFNFGKLAIGWIMEDKILSFLFEHNVIEFFI